MDAIIEKLLTIPVTEFYTSLYVIILSTCSGFLPNNNDLTVAAAAYICQLREAAPTSVALACFSVWCLGESGMFLIGHYFGKHLLASSFFKKRMNPTRIQGIRDVIHRNVFKLIIMLRCSPVLRAHTILTLGALGFKPRDFFIRHIPILFVHVMVVFHFFFYLGAFLRDFYTGNALVVIGIIIIMWLSLMLYMGRKFWNELMVKTSPT